MFSKRSNKSNTPTLDQQVAQQLLENIFEACEMESNTIPLEVLTSYSNYRKERFALQKLILIVIMVLFCTLPLLFVAPSFSVAASEVSTDYNPVYDLTIHTFFPPTSRVIASIDGHNMPVYETGAKTYSIEPTMNGTMTITVALANEQYITQNVEVNGIDRESPVLISNTLEDGLLYLYLSDTASGIDYESVYAIRSSNGETVFPAFYDAEEGYVTFAYPDESLNVFVSDYAGNTLQLILTIK